MIRFTDLQAEMLGRLKFTQKRDRYMRVKDIERTEDVAFSPKIQSLIGIIPPFSQDEIDSDERLKHILEH